MSEYIKGAWRGLDKKGRAIVLIVLILAALGGLALVLFMSDAFLSVWNAVVGTLFG